MNRTERSKTRTIMTAVAAAALTCAATGLGLAIGSPSAHSQSAGKRLVLTEDSIWFGAYDPNGDFAGESKASIEHIFMPWEDVDLSGLQHADAYARERKRMLRITVEPWSWAADPHSPSELLDGILAGRYDANMAGICSAASRLSSPIGIRWAQEMDDSSPRFPWAQWSPEDYIAAYQRFVTQCRKHLPEAKYVWSPKGEESLADFYPGDQYVDAVGLSVFGYQPYDKRQFGKERTFAEALEPGYRLAEGFGKPIIVAEFGYEGDPDYVSGWVKAAAAPYCEFPQLTAVVYFNARETFPWPLDMGRPNWRIGNPATVGLQASEPDSQTMGFSQAKSSAMEMNSLLDDKAAEYRRKHCQDLHGPNAD